MNRGHVAAARIRVAPDALLEPERTLRTLELGEARRADYRNVFGAILNRPSRRNVIDIHASALRLCVLEDCGSHGKPHVRLPDEPHEPVKLIGGEVQYGPMDLHMQTAVWGLDDPPPRALRQQLSVAVVDFVHGMPGVRVLRMFRTTLSELPE